MHVLISIDDTDNPTSPGSGQLAARLADSLIDREMALYCSSISRHQLLVHEQIRYTSHNSSMCFSAELNGHGCDKVIEYVRDFLAKNSAAGSDPGLAVAMDSAELRRDLLDTFGLTAKKSILTKREAYEAARAAGVHLSEHGGDGGGVIGALAGIGLRLNGHDGRFRGWIRAGEAGRIIDAAELRKLPGVEGLIDDERQEISDNGPVYMRDDRIKTVLSNHKQVIPLTRNALAEAEWATLSAGDSKQF